MSNFYSLSPVKAYGINAGTVAHFGSLTKEQKFLISNTKDTYAKVARGIIQVKGANVLGWLNSLCSQKLVNLATNSSAEALILSPKGKIECHLKIINNSRLVWIIVEKCNLESSLDWLTSMIFMSRVTVENVSERYNVFACLRQDGGSIVADYSTPLWIDKWNTVTEGGYQYGQSREEEKNWFYSEIITPINFSLNSYYEVGVNAFETLRIMSGRPRFGAETDKNTLPHELNWLKNAVHLNKGCYRGQEAVAKIHNMGHPPRRLTLLHIDGSNHYLPTVNENIIYENNIIGKVTSSGFHYEAGPIALALIKRKIPENAILNLQDGTIVSQEIIVPSSAGNVLKVPKNII